MLIIAALATLGGQSQAHGDPRVDASLSKLEVGLGEHLTLLASVEHAVGSTVQWPADLELGASIEEVRREVFAVERSGEREHSRVAFTLAVFDRNVTRIPGIALEVRDAKETRKTLKTPELAMAIRSSVDTKAAELRPLRAPADAPIRNWSLLVGAGGVCVSLLVLGVALRLRRNRQDSQPTARAEALASPHEEALKAFDAIEASGRLDGEELKAVFHDMSEVMRAYLGRRFAFPALDQTSSEIRSRLKSCPGSHEWGDAMNAWLSRCDLVKYAGADVDPDEARTTLYGARVLVDRTKEAALAQDRPVEVARA